jgi:hypothetical protein
VDEKHSARAAFRMHAEIAVVRFLIAHDGLSEADKRLVEIETMMRGMALSGARLK